MNALETSIDLVNQASLQEAVDTTILYALHRLQPPVLRDAACYAVEGGKRVRPLLTLSICCAVGGNEVDALPAAGAIELLHTSSLIHDDIMDGSDMRRGQPTVHVMYDIPTAILAGDTLVAVAFKLMQQVDADRKKDAMGCFTDAFLHVCEGQGYDLWLSGKDAVAQPAHKTMVEKKTARLLEASARIGAMLGTDDDRLIRGAALFGYNLGMAFQAHDDLLDATGDAEIMGKPVHADAKNGKATYLTLAYPDSRIISDTHISGTRKVIAGYTETACTFLDTLPPTPSREFLRSLAFSLIERKS